MAYDPNERFAAGTPNTGALRVVPDSIQPKTFKQGTGTLLPLTPVSFDTAGTGTFIPWAGDGTTTVPTLNVSAFVWPDPVVLISNKEVLGNVIMAGQIHMDDIVLPAGMSLAALKGNLRTIVRPLGFNIQGLDDFR